MAYNTNTIVVFIKIRTLLATSASKKAIWKYKNKETYSNKIRTMYIRRKSVKINMTHYGTLKKILPCES